MFLLSLSPGPGRLAEVNNVFIIRLDKATDQGMQPNWHAALVCHDRLKYSLLKNLWIYFWNFVTAHILEVIYRVILFWQNSPRLCQFSLRGSFILIGFLMRNPNDLENI